MIVDFEKRFGQMGVTRFLFQRVYENHRNLNVAISVAEFKIMVLIIDIIFLSLQLKYLDG